MAGSVRHLIRTVPPLAPTFTTGGPPLTKLSMDSAGHENPTEGTAGFIGFHSAAEGYPLRPREPRRLRRGDRVIRSVQDIEDGDVGFDVVKEFSEGWRIPAWAAGADHPLQFNAATNRAIG